MNQNNVNVTSNENPAETTLNKASVITGNESAADRAENIRMSVPLRIMCRQNLPGNLIKAR